MIYYTNEIQIKMPRKQIDRNRQFRLLKRRYFIQFTPCVLEAATESNAL